MTPFQRRPLGLALAIIAITLVAAPGLAAEPSRVDKGSHSITDRTISWPTWGQWRRVLTLEDYNTRIVLFGTMLLGLASGAIGSFTLLRKRALMGDALSHATLPGIGLAFLLTTLAGGDGKSLSVLLTGATISGLIGLAAILFIRNATRLKEDAALGIVLSVFFGAGIAMLGIAQQVGHAAGLEAFIYGKAASMGPRDAQLIGVVGFFVSATCGLLFKELRLLCFDEGFAGSRGYPVMTLDVVLMALVVMVTIVGLQAVGLILMIALLVTPASAARFWTDELWKMTLISALIGAVSSLLGAGLSAVLPRLPTGAMIVLVAAVAFLISMFFGASRGIIVRFRRRRRLDARVNEQHLLRAAYELLEAQDSAPRIGAVQESAPIPVADLLPMRSWNAVQLRAHLRAAKAKGLVRDDAAGLVRLTTQGARQAAKDTRDHRLWEMFLIRYADLAPSQVDRGADAIEHVLDAEMIAELERLLREREVGLAMPASPHPTLAPLAASVGDIPERRP